MNQLLGFISCINTTIIGTIWSFSSCTLPIETPSLRLLLALLLHSSCILYASSSLSLTNERNDFLELPSECLVYWCTILMRYKRRVRKQTEPHSKKRPQKLLRWRRSTSCFAPSELHALLVSHLLCILYRSPFSDSFRMAVDMSIANGESRGKA